MKKLSLFVRLIKSSLEIRRLKKKLNRIEDMIADIPEQPTGSIDPSIARIHNDLLTDIWNEVI